MLEQKILVLFALPLTASVGASTKRLILASHAHGLYVQALPGLVHNIPSKLQVLLCDADHNQSSRSPTGRGRDPAMQNAPRDEPEGRKMRCTPKKLLATSLIACGLLACSSPELTDLPVRTVPQDEIPYSPQVEEAALRGTAVAIALGPQQ